VPDGLIEHGMADRLSPDIMPGENLPDFQAFFAGGIELVKQDKFFFGHGWIPQLDGGNSCTGQAIAGRFVFLAGL